MLVGDKGRLKCDDKHVSWIRKRPRWRRGAGTQPWCVAVVVMQWRTIEEDKGPVTVQI